MLRNYFKIAVRTILRNKAFSFINIAGLSLGVACCLLLYLYVADEFSFDRHHPGLNDLYRIDSKLAGNFGDQPFGSCSPPIAMTMKSEIPEIQSAVRMLDPIGVPESLIKYDDKLFYERDAFIADSTLFDVLGYPLKEGNERKALTDVNTVILSEILARKIFGHQSALDKSIGISQGGPSVNYKVTGVFRDDQKSFIHANFITSMMSEGFGEYVRKSQDASKEWAGQNFVPSFVRLYPGSSKELVEKKMNDILMKHGAAALKALGMHKTLSLEPVKEIYLNSITEKTPRKVWLYVIISIAVFILMIACINFMNLSTAKSTRRSTEIGVRKVMGAYRSSLASQILGEAMIMVMLSILIAVVLVQLALPMFNELSGKALSLGGTNIFYFGLAVVALAIFTGLIAGSYPAFYISSFQPSEVLKGKFNPGNATGTLRQSLVVFQFVIAIVLVCGMIVITRQLAFMKDKDLGFDAASRIVVPLRTATAKDKYETLKAELLRSGVVTRVSGAGYIPGSNVFSDMSFYKSGETMDNAINTKRNAVDEGFLELLGIKLIAGRSFSDNREADSKGKVILNETSVKMFNTTPEEIVGKPLYFDWQGKKYDFEVIGVMADFNQSSLREPVKPYLLEMASNAKHYEFLIAPLPGSKFKESIAGIEKIWKDQVEETPFQFSFLDDDVQKQYDEDRKVSAIIIVFTGIAIFICCLGLYGLSSFMAERRFREIGVRKVMGASVRQIVGMMSKEFVKLVLISFVIAVPLAWYATSKWLQGFEYRRPVSASVFAYAGVSALLIALLTISYESFRAASTNPISSLRNE